MRFELLPTSLRKSVNIEGEGIRQTISFDAHLVTSRDHDYAPSTFKDGRAIRSLGCTIFINAGKSAEGCGTLMFVPAFSDSELGINEPDRLQLDILIPPDALDKLWATVSDGKRIVLGGEVKGLPSKHPYGPGLSPYVWDIEGEENRDMQIEKFWFTDLITASHETMGHLAAIRSQGDSLSASAKKLRKSLWEKHPRPSQVRDICLMALDQAEGEAAKRGLTGWEASRFLDDTIELVDRLQTSLHGYNWKPEGAAIGRLWRHQNLNRFFHEGREALGSWDVSRDDLIVVCRDLLARPWLRLDEMEWIVVSALVFREVFEFGETVKEGAGSFSQAWAYASTQGNLRKMGWAKLKVAALWWLVRWGLVLAGMCGAWFFVERNYYEGFSAFAVLGGALLILIWLLVGFPVGRRAVKEARREQGKLLMTMYYAYATMEPGGPLSPYQIRAALLVAQEKGAVWPSGTFALLDRAAMRDPPVWVI